MQWLATSMAVEWFLVFIYVCLFGFVARTLIDLHQNAHTTNIFLLASQVPTLGLILYWILAALDVGAFGFVNEFRSGTYRALIVPHVLLFTLYFANGTIDRLQDRMGIWILRTRRRWRR